MVVELRQYTLRPGGHEVLARLFEHVLADGQEAVGMRILGWYRNFDDPDQFVWLRSFPNMTQRAEALAAFYGGPVWAEHRAAANATMIDSDNVLLLRGVGELVLPGDRPIVVSIHQFSADVDDREVERFERELGPAWAVLVTEESPNNFPSLPVREGEHVVVRFGARPDPGADEVLRLAR
jgi:NIPSNAP